jgi:hypothetical protein
VPVSLFLEGDGPTPNPKDAASSHLAGPVFPERPQSLGGSMFEQGNRPRLFD